MDFSRARPAGFTTCASGSIGSALWVGRESRLNCSRRYLKKVLVRPAREPGAGDLVQGHLRVGGDHWHLATGGETAPDLADGEPVAQHPRFPVGEVNGGRPVPCRVFPILFGELGRLAHRPDMISGR